MSLSYASASSNAAKAAQSKLEADEQALGEDVIDPEWLARHLTGASHSRLWHAERNHRESVRALKRRLRLALVDVFGALRHCVGTLIELQRARLAPLAANAPTHLPAT